MFKKSAFDKKSSSKSLKYFILAFSLFIVILAVVSLVMLMDSIDYNFDNLTGKTTTEPVETTDAIEENQISLSELTGKSKILFVCENNKEFDFALLIETDFEKSSMHVSAYDKNDIITENITFSQKYSDESVYGVKETLGYNLGTTIDKYIVCTRTEFREILSLFDNIYINVDVAVNYRSYDFNLELKAGKQVLSSDYIVKYLLVSDDNTRAKIMCDILNSVLVPQYSVNSQKLFNEFVNNCKTDISVIDYSEKIDDIIIYSKSDEKFLATVK